MTDYGYGDAEPDYGYGGQDMGYGDAQPDYGYGDQDMGYGDGAPDMGYGDAQPDYGYGDASPDEDYGYGDAPPPQPAPEAHRPKRRCSVTKYSLTSAETGTAEHEMAQQLSSIDRINQFRSGGGDREAPQPTNSAMSFGTNDGGSADPEAEPEHAPAPVKAKGKFSKLRKRLSIFG